MAKRDLAAELLRELGQNRTQYHSGEELSARLGVSAPPYGRPPAACGNRAMPLNRLPGWVIVLPLCPMA